MTLIVKAEGKGFEPSTGCPAPDFESDMLLRNISATNLYITSCDVSL